MHVNNKVSYDEENDILYISFSRGSYSEEIKTKALILYLDKNGNLTRIAIKNAKQKGILDGLKELFVESNS